MLYFSWSIHLFIFIVRTYLPYWRNTIWIIRINRPHLLALKTWTQVVHEIKSCRNINVLVVDIFLNISIRKSVIISKSVTTDSSMRKDWKFIHYLLPSSRSLLAVEHPVPGSAGSHACFFQRWHRSVQLPNEVELRTRHNACCGQSDQKHFMLT